MAGYKLPIGLDAIQAFDTNPDTLVLTYHNSGCDTYLSAPMPQPSAELKCGSDVSCFFDGKWRYTNGSNPYYSAPTRNWGFDTDLSDMDKLPPGTPTIRIFQRKGWNLEHAGYANANNQLPDAP